jgi:hypothetical protein
MKRKIAPCIAAAAAAMVTYAGDIAANPPTSHADPPAPVCDAPGLPPCAGPGPLTPEQQCGLLAWMTWMPCNWWGMQVPAGTPGSL